MKKLVITFSILIFVFIIGCSLSIFFVFVHFFTDNNSDINLQAMPPQGIKPVAINMAFGSSMEPTIFEGDMLTYDSMNLSPKPGEIVVFECLAKKCLNGDKLGDADRSKRLMAITDDNAYWFEGDNKLVSNDSNDYGLLSSDEIRIMGVLTHINDEKVLPKDVSSFSIPNTVNYTKTPTRIPSAIETTNNSDDIKAIELQQRIDARASNYEFDKIMEDVNEQNFYVAPLPSIPTQISVPTVKKIDPPNFNPKVCITQDGEEICNHD